MIKYYFFNALLICLFIIQSPVTFARMPSLKLMHSGIDPNHTSIVVMDITANKILFEHNPNLKLNPASGVKLITAAAALSNLGHHYQLNTHIYSDIPPHKGHINKLYIKGTGDPFLVSERIWLIGQQLREQGITHIDHGIIIDNSYFDDYVPKMAGDTHRAYAAKITPTAVNFNSVTIKIIPDPNHPNRTKVMTSPSVDYFHIQNKTKIGKKNNITIQSTPLLSGEKLIITGRIANTPKGHTIYRSIAKPNKYTTSVFKYILNQHEIHIGPHSSSHAIPPSAHHLLTFPSLPLRDLIISMNKFSNNFMAEQITKHMGATMYGVPGTTKKGLRVIQSYLNKINVNINEHDIENASGLSHITRISAKQLSDVLVATYNNFKIAPEFMSALSVMGIDGTTKKWPYAKQMPGNARSKSGSLTGISSLSGYIPLRNNHIGAFVFISNKLPKNLYSARDAHGHWVYTLLERF